MRTLPCPLTPYPFPGSVSNSTKHEPRRGEEEEQQPIKLDKFIRLAWYKAAESGLVRLGRVEAISLCMQHDECVQNLRAFRSYHLGAATKYLVRTTKGTGTSTYRDLLKEMIVNTSEAMIGGGDGQSSR